MSAFSFGKRLCAWCVQHEAAQRGEISEDTPQPVMPAPWQRAGSSSATLTQALVGVNVVVYLAMGLVGGGLLSSPSSQQLIRSGANYGPLTFGGEWWRLLTYNFLHGSLLHIGFNMWCLWDLGALCESLYGTWTFGALYMISGVAGGLASTGFHPHRLSVGASGAIFGLAGALIAAFYLGEFSLPRPVIQAHLRSVIAFVGYNIILGALASGTDNMCHLGGVVAGLICGALIAKAAPSENDVAARLAIIACAALSLTGIAYGLDRSRSYVAHVQRGQELLTQEKYGDAISELQIVTRSKPKYVPAHMNLAQAFYGNRQFSQAKTELDQVLSLQPENEDALYFLGFVDLAAGSPAEARQAFSRLLAKGHDSPAGHYGLGMALAAEGNDKSAVGEFQLTAKMRPDYEGVYYRLGNSQAKLKLYDDAIASFTRELQNGDDYDTEIALANAYRMKGKTDKAAETLQRAEQLKKK
ncbi:MAG TPA: rhomboid family intramembrane serine protease [Terriglobales bacterium]|nr:rhomboid family intramembrane serine protease [Terriglobales bacterium]